MQASLAIVAHALRMLIFEVGTTLRVLSPALLLVLGSTLIAVLFAQDALVAVQTTTPETLVMPQGSSILVLFIMGLAGVAGYALMAILWHRHVLLSGMERSAIMRPSLRIFFTYLGKALLVGLLQLLIGIPITLGIGALAAIGGGGALLLSLLGLLGGVIFAWVALRISLVLPAAAVDARMTIPDSWEATRALAPTLWGVAALMVGLNILSSLLSGLLTTEPTALAFLIQTVFFLLEGIVFISVLTTLFGHLVEGRPLA